MIGNGDNWGQTPFVMIGFKSPLPGADAEIIVDLHWPGGEEGEVTKRLVVL